MSERPRGADERMYSAARHAMRQELLRRGDISRVNDPRLGFEILLVAERQEGNVVESLMFSIWDNWSRIKVEDGVQTSYKRWFGASRTPVQAAYAEIKGIPNSPAALAAFNQDIARAVLALPAHPQAQ